MQVTMTSRLLKRHSDQEFQALLAEGNAMANTAKAGKSLSRAVEFSGVLEGVPDPPSPL